MSKYAMKKKVEETFILSEEVAIEQVNELLGYYDIDIEALIAGDEKSGGSFEKALDHVARGFRKEVLSIDYDKDGKIQVVQKLVNGSELTYAEISAKNKIAMEKFDPQAGYSRIYAFMGSLCGVGKAGIEKLGPQDLAIVEVLGTVFLHA